jgi:hypothetical protein
VSLDIAEKMALQEEQNTASPVIVAVLSAKDPRFKATMLVSSFGTDIFFVFGLAIGFVGFTGDSVFVSFLPKIAEDILLIREEDFLAEDFLAEL